MSHFGKSLAVASGMCCLVLGCFSGAPRACYPLAVRVEDASGQPLAGAYVVFSCVDLGVSATGTTGEDGSAAMTTHGKMGDGVVAGNHRVAVSIPPSFEDTAGVQRNRKQKPRLIPQRFANPDTSGLSYTITKDGPREIKISIPPK